MEAIKGAYQGTLLSLYMICKAGHELAYCLKTYGHILPEGYVSDVFGVVVDPFLKILSGPARSSDLPEAGNSGANRESCIAPERAESVFSFG